LNRNLRPASGWYRCWPSSSLRHFRHPHAAASMSPSKVKAFLGRIQLVAETRAPSVSVPSTPVLALRAWVLTAPTASLGIGCRQLVGFQALPSPKPASRCALRRPLDAAPLSVLRQCFTGSIGLSMLLLTGKPLDFRFREASTSCRHWNRESRFMSPRSITSGR